MSHPLESSSTRERILEAGYELLMRQGYHGTGLKQILDAAKVPKGSFYHYFDSKEHLAVELIEHYQAQELRRWEHEFITPHGNRLSEIRHGLNTVIAEYNHNPDTQFGCLLATLSGELAFTTPFIRSAIDRANNTICAAITRDIELAQRQGDIRADYAAQELAELFWSAWQGAIQQVKASRSTRPLERVVALLINQFYCVASQPPLDA